VSAGRDEARALDAADPVPTRRAEFRVPRHSDGDEWAYLAGNSLGLQPRRTAIDLTQELEDWATFGVEGHEEALRPWVSYHELLRGPTARLVGGREQEVVAMNSLTVNLHLLMASFYRPTGDRYRIVIEDSAFPSDSYAVRSHADFRGYGDDDAVVRMAPRSGEHHLRTEDIAELLEHEGHQIALLLFGGVNYLTGQLMDIAEVTRLGHAAGATVGWDLAHAAGNVPLALHDWDVDFAAWCTYKYLNSGPGAVAAAFVHERHVADPSLHRLAGWWSNDPANRFEMLPELTRTLTADAWQLSNPPIMAMAPVLTSLGIFDSSGMETLRERSCRLTGYLETRLDEACPTVTILTPRDPQARGAQLSVRLTDDAALRAAAMRREHGVVVDVRRPNVIRIAPTPLYNTYEDCWRAVEALANTAVS
jgi:kynureninase